MENKKHVPTLFNYINYFHLQNLCNYFPSSSGKKAFIINNTDYSILVSSGAINLNFLKNTPKTLRSTNPVPDTIMEGTFLSLSTEYYVYDERDSLIVVFPITLKGDTIAYFCFNHEFIQIDETYSLQIQNLIKLLIMSFEKVEAQNHILEKLKIQKEKEHRELQASEERFRLVLEGSQLGFWDWNIATGEVVRNERWANMLGYTFDEIKNTTYQWEDFLHPDDRSKAWESIYNHLEGISPIHEMEYRMLTKNGEYKWIFDRAMVTARDLEGKAVRMSGTHLDITERKIKEKELIYWASHDKLTNLYNRNFLENELSRIIEDSLFPIGIMIVDIDNLKEINDTYGHLVGDEIIKRASLLLVTALGKDNIVIRTGGDEFTILVYEGSSKSLEFYVNEIRKLEKEDKNFIPVRISIGFSIAETSSDIDETIKMADQLMYLDKKNRKIK